MYCKHNKQTSVLNSCYKISEIYSENFIQGIFSESHIPGWFLIITILEKKKKEKKFRDIYISKELLTFGWSCDPRMASP